VEVSFCSVSSVSPVDRVVSVFLQDSCLSVSSSVVMINEPGTEGVSVGRCEDMNLR
jgi:hypothetical protein